MICSDKPKDSLNIHQQNTEVVPKKYQRHKEASSEEHRRNIEPLSNLCRTSKQPPISISTTGIMARIIRDRNRFEMKAKSAIPGDPRAMMR